MNNTNTISQRVFKWTHPRVTPNGNVHTDKIPVGVLIAQKIDSDLFIGYSRRNPVDKFNFNEGVRVALSSPLISANEIEHLIPDVFKKNNQLNRFIDRANRYFYNPNPTQK